MVPRDEWTDERLDDLKERVDVGFVETKAEMRRGFAETKAEMREGFARVDADMRGLRSEMTDRFDSLNRNLIVVAAAMISLAAAVIAAVIGIAVL